MTCRFRSPIAALALCLAAGSVGTTSCSSGAVPASDDDFLAVTDCRELERLASAEVDRINGAQNADIAAAATARFHNIVSHRDAICG